MEWEINRFCKKSPPPFQNWLLFMLVFNETWLIFQDVRLLFHKCALLYSQNRKKEFVELGGDMMDWYFIDVASHTDLYGR